MSSEIEKLKDIGAQKIYEQTHVPKNHVQAILHSSFEGLNKVQILGFISILEREYHVDLSKTRDSANVYFDQLSNNEENENREIFVAVREKKSSNTVLYLVILVILAIGLYITLKDTVVIEDNKIDNTLIEDIKEKVVEEDNISKKPLDIVKKEESNITKADLKPESKEIKKVEIKVVKTEVVKKDKPKKVESFRILPKSKVWVGYIDISNNKHYQIVVRNSLKLDAKKDWLILFGHPQVEFELNGERKDFNGNIRFAYINSELKPISLKEFKKLNKGSRW